MKRLWEPISATPLALYRFCFGINLLLELVFFNDNVVYNICFGHTIFTVPLFRHVLPEYDEFQLDKLLYVGIVLSILIASNAYPSLTKIFAFILLLIYGFLRVTDYGQWNNHYYLNMLTLGLFLLVDAVGGKTVPRWQVVVIRLLFALVYFFAGVSKISTAWFNESIMETMVEKYEMPIPMNTSVMVWSGLFLDLIGGLILFISEIRYLGWLTIVTLLGFASFHAFNCLWLFRSIKFFPYHMLCTFVLCCGNYKSQPDNDRKDFKVTRGSKIKCLIAFLILATQSIVACRRFFLVVDYPWQIWKANDLTEFDSHAHEFSWRMKSRTFRDTISPFDHVSSDSEEKIKMMTFTLGFKNGTIQNYPDLIDLDMLMPGSTPVDPEAVMQATTRLKKIYDSVQHEEGRSELVSVKVAWWVARNKSPFQLVVNASTNLLLEPQLPFWFRSPKSVVNQGITLPNNHFELLMGLYASLPDGWRMNEFGSHASPYLLDSPLMYMSDVYKQPFCIICLHGHLQIFIENEIIDCKANDDPVLLPSDGQWKFKTILDDSWWTLIHHTPDNNQTISN